VCIFYLALADSSQNSKIYTFVTVFNGVFLEKERVIVSMAVRSMGLAPAGGGFAMDPPVICRVSY
jgi:hypothetical protein